MPHTEFHNTCREYIAQAAGNYKTVSTLDDAKTYWNQLLSHISIIQGRIEMLEKAEELCKEMAKSGINMPATIDCELLRKDLGLNETPAPPEPEPPAQPPKPATPSYNKKQLRLILRKPSTWTLDKKETVANNPEIHPDSILNSGNITNNYWTWDEVEYAADQAQNIPVDIMAEKIPEHTIPEIETLLSALNIKHIKTTPKPEPPAKRTTSIEQFLPEEIRNPTAKTRIRIARLQSNMTVQQVVSKSGVKRNRLYEIENEDTSFVTQEEAMKLAKAFGITINTLLNDPISDALPFAPDMTPAQRLRNARIRTGSSVETFSSKLNMTPDQIRKYESNTYDIDPTLFSSIEIIFGIPRWVIETAVPPVATTPLTATVPNGEKMSTGEKLKYWRSQKRMDVLTLARKAGCSTTHIYNIEDCRTHPSDEMLIRLANALNIQPFQLQGENILQPASVFKEKAARKKGATPAPPVTTMLNASVQEKLKKAREVSGLTQKQMAEQSEIPLTHIITLETDGLNGGNSFFYRKACTFLGIKP